MYFRHGAKSEPGTTQDLRRFIEQQVESVRRSWMDNIRVVTDAPTGALVRVYAPGAAPVGLPDALPVRSVADAASPGFPAIDKDTIYSYRVTDLLAELNRLLTTRRQIVPFDIQCVRKAYDIDANEDVFHVGKFVGSPQYRQAFLDWLITQFNSDAEFFERVRLKQRTMTVGTSTQAP